MPLLLSVVAFGGDDDGMRHDPILEGLVFFPQHADHIRLVGTTGFLVLYSSQTRLSSFSISAARSSMCLQVRFNGADEGTQDRVP